MTQQMQWPALADVEDADTRQLLDWNEVLPAPAEGTENYATLARIVERLRAEQASGTDEYPGHPGWPGV